MLVRVAIALLWLALEPVLITAASLAQAAGEADQAACRDHSKPDAAVEACKRLVDEATKALAMAYHVRAKGLLAKGQHDQAIADYSEAIRLDPNNASSFYDRSTLLNNKGEHDRAIADLTDVIRIDPNSFWGYYRRCFSRGALKQYEQAISDCTEAIRLDSKNAWGYFQRGIIHGAKGQADQALADYSEAVRSDPKFAAAYFNRASIYDGKGAHDKAISDFTDAIRSSPNDLVPYQRRGWSYEQKGELAKAADDYRKALSFAPTKGNDWENNHHAAAKRLLDALLPRLGLGRRVALVIGNGTYAHAGPLPNPVNDAKAVAAVLRKLNFSEVRELANADRAAMVTALSTFATLADSADWAVVYFAGHGMEVAGRNYLLPTDANLAHERDIGDQAIELQDKVITRIRGAKQLRLVLLDACRNNPFPRMVRLNPGRSISRGLASVAPARGELVVFATEAGEIAMDGVGGQPNSPFITALLEHIETPSLEIDRLFRRVGETVHKKTGQKQDPAVYGKLPDADFYFKR